MSCEEYINALEKSIDIKLDTIVKNKPSEIVLEMADCTNVILGSMMFGGMIFPVLGPMFSGAIGYSSCSKNAKKILDINSDLNKIKYFKKSKSINKEMCTYNLFGNPNGINFDYKTKE